MTSPATQSAQSAQAATDTTQAAETGVSSQENGGGDIRARLTEQVRAAREKKEGASSAERDASGKFASKQADQKGATNVAEGKGDAKEKQQTETEKEPTEPPATPERQAFRAEKRKFSKYVAKREAELSTRETGLSARAQQVEQAEAAANELLQLATSDPVKFLAAKGHNLRDLLLRFADEDGKDPTQKRLEELERRTKEREEAERQERERAEQARRAEEGNKQLRVACAKAWSELKEEFPLITEHSDGVHEVAEAARKEMLAHYKQHGTQLDFHSVFTRLERNLRRYLAQKATEQKGSEPPEQVRTVADGKAVNPAVRKRTADVSPSASRASTEPREGFRTQQGEANRNSIREKLLKKLEERRNA